MIAEAPALHLAQAVPDVWRCIAHHLSATDRWALRVTCRAAYSACPPHSLTKAVDARLRPRHAARGPIPAQALRHLQTLTLTVALCQHESWREPAEATISQLWAPGDLAALALHAAPDSCQVHLVVAETGEDGELPGNMGSQLAAVGLPGTLGTADVPRWRGESLCSLAALVEHFQQAGIWARVTRLHLAVADVLGPPAQLGPRVALSACVQTASALLRCLQQPRVVSMRYLAISSQLPDQNELARLLNKHADSLEHLELGRSPEWKEYAQAVAASSSQHGWHQQPLGLSLPALRTLLLHTSAEPEWLSSCLADAFLPNLHELFIKVADWTQPLLRTLHAALHTSPGLHISAVYGS